MFRQERSVLRVLDAVLCSFSSVNRFTCVKRCYRTELRSLGKLLVANRGEIACRVIQTARALGVPTVAVYSDVDRHAAHVQLADEALEVGGAAPRQSYLNIDAILEAARRSGARSVHPGYGFLSENEAFVRACSAAGVAFVGPPAEAIAAMGHKSNSKEIMERANVPVVPGYHGSQLDEAGFAAKANEIGYPILIKAVLGGGGKGMKIAKSPAEFQEALRSAVREARTAFNDSEILLERLITRPRHIEVQIIADKHGNCLYVFDRDCSVQRRHQKVLEEAPAPGLSDAKRREIGEAAVAAAKAVGYEGAGTVEFIVDTDTQEFFFMEMNTRLQVEHPITELISGLDLVEMQLRITAGQALPLGQQQLTSRGHAVEARIYSEQPARGFLPGAGTVAHWRPPPGCQSFGLDRGVCRLDAAVRQGDAIGVHYDPLIAKVVTWGEDREEALKRLDHALGGLQVGGLPTNIDFVRQVAAHPAFQAAQLDTGFIERHKVDLLRTEMPSGKALALAAAARVLLSVEREAQDAPRHVVAAGGPWDASDGFRSSHWLSVPFEMQAELGAAQEGVSGTITFKGAGAFDVALEGGAAHEVRDAALVGADLAAIVDGVTCSASVCQHSRGPCQHLDVWLDGTHSHFVWPTQSWTEGGAEGAHGKAIVAPMTSRVGKVNIAEGQAVRKGDVLLVVEAMKMEHPLLAPADSTVCKVLVSEGQQVQDSDVLCTLD